MNDWEVNELNYAEHTNAWVDHQPNWRVSRQRNKPVFIRGNNPWRDYENTHIVMYRRRFGKIKELRYTYKVSFKDSNPLAINSKKFYKSLDECKEKAEGHAKILHEFRKYLENE